MPRVLIVDDDEQLCRMLATVLAAEGFEVELAGDGKAGLEAIKRAVPDVVVTDLFMPEVDGLEVLGAIRREYLGLPVIALSGGGSHQNTDILESARTLGAAAILEKPFSPEELVEAVRRCVEE